MSREILFRGKRIDNKEWVYGVPFFIESEEKAFIINNCSTLYFDKNISFKGVEVDCETIGQYTGLKDKNGVKIFEGDILNNKEIVVFEDGSFNIKSDSARIVLNNNIAQHLLVIGNIHDNE